MKRRRKPTHPGEILHEDVIKSLGLTTTEAAKRLGVTHEALTQLLNCRSPLNPEMAIRVGKATNTTPESWLFMQAKLDLWYAGQQFPEVETFENSVAV